MSLIDEKLTVARNKLLLENRYAPITREFLLIKADAATACRLSQEWETEMALQSGESQSVRVIHGGLLKALDALGLLSPWHMRDVFVPTVNPDWCAVFSNCSQTADHTTLAWNLAKRSRVYSIVVTDIPSAFNHRTGRGVYGEVSIRVIPGDVDNIRAIRLAQTETPYAWEFIQVGDTLPFEQQERYMARRNPDRFTHDMLVEYLSAMGLHPFDEGFYSTVDAAYLAERHSAEIDALQSRFTLAEARREQEDASLG